MTGAVLPDPQADRVGYVLAVCEQRVQLARSEMNSHHALAEVALWRGIVERHVSYEPAPGHRWCVFTDRTATPWPCPDLLAVVAACQAYMGGATDG